MWTSSPTRDKTYPASSQRCGDSVSPTRPPTETDETRHPQVLTIAPLLARIARGRTEQSMIVTGLRGVGKTVLLGQFRTKALERDWVVVELEVSKHDDTQFRRELSARLRSALLELSPRARWTERLSHAAGVLKSFTVGIDASGNWSAGLDVAAAEGFADHANLAMDITDVFIALGEATKEQGRGVVLLFDEVQFLSRSQLGALIEALHKMVQRKLPITMVGA
ncbi:MAG: ATP-binding protein, partial [Actinobacteria bacterium]|nr:ATP-binding protein [Actinomycetota bacterium]